MTDPDAVIRAAEEVTGILEARGVGAMVIGGVVDVRGSFGVVQIVNYGGRFPAVIDGGLAAADTVIRPGSHLRIVPLPHLIALKLYAGGRSPVPTSWNCCPATPTPMWPPSATSAGAGDCVVSIRSSKRRRNDDR